MSAPFFHPPHAPPSSKNLYPPFPGLVSTGHLSLTPPLLSHPSLKTFLNGLHTSVRTLHRSDDTLLREVLNLNGESLAIMVRDVKDFQSKVFRGGRNSVRFSHLLGLGGGGDGAGDGAPLPLTSSSSSSSTTAGSKNDDNANINPQTLSKTPTQPMTLLPSHIFHNLTLDGPLHHLILSIFKYKSINNIKNTNFDVGIDLGCPLTIGVDSNLPESSLPVDRKGKEVMLSVQDIKKVGENVSCLKFCRVELERLGFLEKKVIAFDSSVPQEIVEHITREVEMKLSDSVLIVPLPLNYPSASSLSTSSSSSSPSSSLSSPAPSHVIAYNPTIDSPHASEKNYLLQSSQPEYLRVFKRFRDLLPTGLPSDNGSATYVHWWYYPGSFDLFKSDFNNSVAPEVVAKVEVKKKKPAKKRVRKYLTKQNKLDMVLEGFDPNDEVVGNQWLNRFIDDENLKAKEKEEEAVIAAAAAAAVVKGKVKVEEKEEEVVLVDVEPKLKAVQVMEDAKIQYEKELQSYMQFSSSSNTSNAQLYQLQPPVRRPWILNVRYILDYLFWSESGWEGDYVIEENSMPNVQWVKDLVVGGDVEEDDSVIASPTAAATANYNVNANVSGVVVRGSSTRPSSKSKTVAKSKKGAATEVIVTESEDRKRDRASAIAEIEARRLKTAGAKERDLVVYNGCLRYSSLGGGGGVSEAVERDRVNESRGVGVGVRVGIDAETDVNDESTGDSTAGGFILRPSEKLKNSSSSSSSSSSCSAEQFNLSSIEHSRNVYPAEFGGGSYVVSKVGMLEKPLARIRGGGGDGEEELSQAESEDTTKTDGELELETILPHSHVPTWYIRTNISTFEKSALGEWHDLSSPHRTPVTYITTRESIIKLYWTGLCNTLTFTMLRRNVAGDYASLLRLFNLLCVYGFINWNCVESEGSENRIGFIHGNDWMMGDDDKVAMLEGGWSEGEEGLLGRVVLSASSEGVKKSEDGEPDKKRIKTIDWDAVSAKMDGRTSKECEVKFFALTPASLSTTSTSSDNSDFDVNKYKASIFNDLMNSIDPKIASIAFTAALNAGASLDDAKKSGILGSIAYRAQQLAIAEESKANDMRSEIRDLKVQALEARMERLRDVEELVEVERRSVGWERRELFERRCRYWLGE